MSSPKFQTEIVFQATLEAREKDLSTYALMDITGTLLISHDGDAQSFVKSYRSAIDELRKRHGVGGYCDGFITNFTKLFEVTKEL